tara:strand:- start:5996 stop:7354 length:1359 start_codon:yes stop_codon:yes gene_type:complete
MDKEKKVSLPVANNKLDSKYDFLPKLMQPKFLPHVKDYILWQAELRQAPDETVFYDKMPDAVPLSANMDPTSACNFGCPYCVDIDVLNTGVQYDWDNLRGSIDLMHSRGLQSIIIIGGGEPTLYPHYEDLVRYVKGKGMQAGTVTNGTGMAKIARISPFLDENDWVRLSLDAGTNETFQAIHLPKGKMVQLTANPDGSVSLPVLQAQKPQRIPITLEDICRGAKVVRGINPDLTLGYTYIIAWDNATSNDSPIVTNLDEMEKAAHLARDHGLTYLSIKPLLDRDPETGSEIIAIDKSSPHYEGLIEQIRTRIDAVKQLETDSFKIAITNNLRAMLRGNEDHYKDQPKNCHINYFRQVLGIRGIALCPTYRKDPEANIGDMEAYASESNLRETRRRTAERIRNLDVSQKCRKMVCMYRDPNWWFEDMIEKVVQHGPRALDELQPGEETGDYSI